MAEIDTKREIRRAVDTGKVVFGFRQSEKSVLSGKSALVVVSVDSPQTAKEKIRNLGKTCKVPVFEFDGTGLSLGAVCGKPFVISTMTVEDTGKSRVLDIIAK